MRSEYNSGDGGSALRCCQWDLDRLHNREYTLLIYHFNLGRGDSSPGNGTVTRLKLKLIIGRFPKVWSYQFPSIIEVCRCVGVYHWGAMIDQRGSGSALLQVHMWGSADNDI
jgi:hypothetical protein